MDNHKRPDAVMSTKDVLQDLRGHQDMRMDSDLGRSHSSVAEDVLEDIKEQLREELAMSMKETREDLLTLKHSIQQSRIADSVGYTSNEEVAKLRAELASLRKQLSLSESSKEKQETDFATSPAFEPKNNLKSMKAEFIKAMARKALTRDMSMGLTNEMNTVFEDDEDSIDNDSLGSESKIDELIGKKAEERLPKKSKADDENKERGENGTKKYTEVGGVHTCITSGASAKCLQLKVGSVDSEQSRTRDSFIESSSNDGNNDKTSSIDGTHRTKAPEDVFGAEKFGATTSSLLVQSRMNHHTLESHSKVIDESMVIEPEPVEQDLWDENEKRGTFSRFRLIQKLASRGLKKSQKNLYMSLQPSGSDESEITSVESSKRTRTKAKPEISILSPRRVPTKMPSTLPSKTPRKMPSKTPTKMPSRVPSRSSTQKQSDGDMAQPRPMDYRSQAKTKGGDDKNGCVLLCLSPTATNPPKKTADSISCQAGGCPVAVSSSVSSFGSEEEIERFGMTVTETGISARALLPMTKPDKSSKADFPGRWTKNSNKHHSTKQAGATEESIEVSRTTSSSSNTSLARHSGFSKDVFADPEWSAVLKVDSATGEIEAFQSVPP